MDLSIPPQKQCTTCLKFLPATTEYFYKSKTGKYGICSTCKMCQHTYEQSRKEYQKAYRDAHKEEIAASSRAYRETHKAQDTARKKEYQQKYKERGTACTKRYQDRHKDRVVAYKKRYRETHMDQYKAQCRSARQNRRARIKKAEGKHTSADVRKQYANQKGKCYYCRAKVDINYHVDHVIPLAKGGSNNPENLVIACPACNRHKNDKIIRLL